MQYADQFAHGYVLTGAPRPASCLGWRETHVGPLSLYRHAKTAHSTAASADKSAVVAIVGQPVDLEEDSIDSAAIATECLALLVSNGREAAVRYLAYLGGRFAGFLVLDGQLTAVPDCHATQAAYWAVSNGAICISSHTALVGEALGLGPDHEALELLARLKVLRPQGTRYYPGVRTAVAGVRPVIANCLLQVDLSGGSAHHVRFYPFEDMYKAPSVEAAFAKFELYFLSHVKLLTRFGATGISLTGGKDSRATLSAAKAVGAADLFAFTFYQYLHPSSGYQDMYAANDRAFRAGIRHKVLKWTPHLNSEAFDAMFLKTWPDGGQARGTARSMYEELPHDFYQLQSTIAETGTVFYHGRAEKKISAKRLTALWQGTAISEMPEYSIEFQKYLEYSQFNQPELRNIDYHDAFYWEHRNTCWAANRYHEADLGHRVLLPFNHRGLIEAMLSIPVADRRRAILLEMFDKKYPL